MNIIEAIKSGKPFRRNGQKEWKTEAFIESKFIAYYYAESCGVPQKFRPNEKSLVNISLADLLADDWEVYLEVEGTKVEITSKQFWDAYFESIRESGPDWREDKHMHWMARKLGLEPYD